MWPRAGRFRSLGRPLRAQPAPTLRSGLRVRRASPNAPDDAAALFRMVELLANHLNCACSAVWGLTSEVSWLVRSCLASCISCWSCHCAVAIRAVRALARHSSISSWSSARCAWAWAARWSSSCAVKTFWSCAVDFPAIPAIVANWGRWALQYLLKIVSV